MATIDLTIPDMKTPHCQMTVTNTVKATGASVKTVAAGRAVLELTNGVTIDTVIEAVQKTGYRVIH